jgi:hypothetical protein
MHRLNMELDLQILFGLRCTQLYSLAETPQLSPLPLHIGSYTRTLLVSQDRHLFVTPWFHACFSNDDPPAGLTIQVEECVSRLKVIDRQLTSEQLGSQGQFHRL